MSTSASIRKEGAILYGEAFHSKELAPGLKLERAKGAIRLFMDARNAASSEGDGEAWVYATKNHGMTSSMLASTKEFTGRLGSEMVYYYFKEGLSFLTEAYVNGKRLVLATEWYAKLENMFLSVIESAVEYIIDQSEDWRFRCAKLSQLLPSAQASDSTSAHLHVKMASEMMKHTIVCSEQGDYREASSTLHEMYQPLNFARQLLQRLPEQLRPISITAELEDIEHSQRRYLCRVTSAQCRGQAETLEDELLLDNEELNMDLAMIILDLYSQALLAARSALDGEACLESEARAAAGIGTFHHLVLKNEERGHTHLFHAVQLADTITHTAGGAFFNKPWYQKAKTVIEEYRKKRLSFDQAAIAKQRAPTLENLKPQLTAIAASIAAFSGKSYK